MLVIYNIDHTIIFYTVKYFILDSQQLFTYLNI